MAKRLETKTIFDEWAKTIVSPRMLKLLTIHKEISEGKKPTLPDFNTNIEDTIAVSFEVPIRKAFSVLERRLNSLEKRIAAIEPSSAGMIRKTSSRSNNRRKSKVSR